MGMVGNGARVGCTKNEMEISLAGALCLPRHYWRLSLRGGYAGAVAGLVNDQVVSSNAKRLVNLAVGFRHPSRVRTFCAGMVGNS